MDQGPAVACSASGTGSTELDRDARDRHRPGNDLAASYLEEVARLTERWRDMLRTASDPRADAAAWAIIDLLPAHPVITAPIAGAVTGRAKAAVHNALDQLATAGVLELVAGGRRNRSWEATGLLDSIADLEAGELPT